jgi:hypothetical protein
MIEHAAMSPHGYAGRSGSPPEIAALGKLPSVVEIGEQLGRIANSYGRVSSIIPLPATHEGDDEQCGFLVNFERTQDAMAASEVWHCYQFGFTSVLVSVRRSATGKRS